MRFIGCCGAYCRTCKSLIEGFCKGCKLGYDEGERDIYQSKCKTKICCFKEKQFEIILFKAFPDFHETIEDIIAEGDKVWVRSTVTATHIGEFGGLAPTGRKFTEVSVDIFRVVNRKIVEGWNIQDELDFLKQLGIIEYKGFPNEVK